MRDQLIELQRVLLPKALPPIGCTEAAAEYRAHNHDFRIGGDWYDLIDIPERNKVVAIVGDVVGHGVEQIGVMGQLRAASNALARVCDGPASLLDALDRFAAGVPGAKLTTVAVMMLDGDGTARLALAGHPPLLRITAEGRSQVLELGKNGALRIGGSNTEAVYDALVGDLIVLYTDGVIERRNVPLDSGIDELARFLIPRRDRPCGELATAIVDEFAGASDDDRAVLVMRPVHHRASGYRLNQPQVPSVGFG